MSKIFTSSNSLLVIPIAIFVLLIFSISLVIFYPYYSNTRIYIETNTGNTSTSLGPETAVHSTLTNSSNNEISGFDCTINNNDFDPMCRLGIWINNSKTSGLDLSDFENLKIYGNFITPTEHDFLRVSLRNYEDNIDLNDIETHYKFNLIEIKSSQIKQPIVVDFKRLIVPNWWMATVIDQNIKSEIDLTNVPLIEISTAHENSEGDYKLRVSAIELNKRIFTLEKLYEYLLISWAAFFLLIFIGITIFLGLKTKQKFKNERILIEINQSLSKRSEKLEIAHKTDELTGVLNRNGMKDKMLECLSNNWFPLCAVMIDIDHFKNVNDKLGHQQGDEVLIKFGELLNSFIKNKESVSRYGGEEFLILIPLITPSSIHPRLEQLREDIEKSDFDTGLIVTASFGVASCDHKQGFNSLVEKADKALYESKNKGRNRITYAT